MLTISVWSTEVWAFAFAGYPPTAFSRFSFFEQKAAYEVRISDWSSDVCSSDLLAAVPQAADRVADGFVHGLRQAAELADVGIDPARVLGGVLDRKSVV